MSRINSFIFLSVNFSDGGLFLQLVKSISILILLLAGG